MPDFQYIARELSGREVTGLLTAGSEQEAVNSLAVKSLFPTQISLADTGPRKLAGTRAQGARSGRNMAADRPPAHCTAQKTARARLEAVLNAHPRHLD